MALKSKLRSFRRFIPLASALLLAALVAIPASNIALAQTPPGDEINLVNADRDFVERKGGGEFVARNRAGKSRLGRGIWAVKPT